METKKTLFGIMAIAGLMASCMNDETYRAGFVVESPSNSINSVYANNASDSLIFYGYGDWEIVDLSGYDNSWLTVPIRQGKGYTVYSQVVSFAQNTTGKSRTGVIQIKDTSHPDEARLSLAYIQYATRGDGSFGTAADVKSITGTDGSSYTFEYDDQHRVTQVKVQNSENTLSNLKITYGYLHMTVKDGNNTFSVDCSNDYQPNMLMNNGDTIGYFSRYYPNYAQAPANYIFNFEHRGLTSSSCVTYQFPYNKYSLAPDSIHNADTLYLYKDGKLTNQYGLTYGQTDNRYQTVDANQLILGVEKCDPYLLASLFRYTRNSSIISEIKNNEEQISVTTTINSNKSVNQMTVTRGSETVTYTFNY